MWESGGIAPPFLTSAADGDEWLALCPASLSPGKEHYSMYQLDRKLDGPQILSGRCREEKNFLLPPGIEPCVFKSMKPGIHSSDFAQTK
jgi:hypothetical protein